jgi:Icc-related predicted phosphoesterase
MSNPAGIAIDDSSGSMPSVRRHGAAALVMAAAVAWGCRSTEAATGSAQAGGGEWSCGAVHGEATVRRPLGRGGRVKLGAIADSNGTAPATMANLARLGRVFSQEHVDAVLALGDLGANEEEIAAVLIAIGAAAKAPVLALAGEREAENSFHSAVKRVQSQGVEVMDLVDARLVDTGIIDIVSVPGYPFSRKGCHYSAADLDGVARLVGKRDQPRLVAAHTPPRGTGDGAIDWALGDVNAGDAAMSALVERLHPKAALFAHVDEAGGRAAGERLNVGSVERGMAAIVEFADGRATHRVLR